MSSVSSAGRDIRMHVKNVRVYCEGDYTHQNLVMTFVVSDTVRVCSIGSYCQEQ
jgi:phosphatidylserine decarboxylase